MLRAPSIKLFFGVALILASACTSTKPAADDDSNIGWFTSELQIDGIVTSHAGSADTTLPSDFSASFLLNGFEQVDVYQFGSSSLAIQIAEKLVSDNPRLIVYRHEELVVMRRSKGDAAVSQSLHRFMGRRV